MTIMDNKTPLSYDTLSDREREIYAELVAVRDREIHLQAIEHMGQLRLTEVKNSGGKGFFQKLMKKLIDWYMEPILKQQSDFNREAVLFLRRLHDEL